ncbi:MAG TPA: O-antigen ligase family protein [Candidatus Elarobacter sp.]|jgi:O-antigen ligase|nr:O-antigen ligase family protein [Candidatus Elarobacter sp.]
MRANLASLGSLPGALNGAAARLRAGLGDRPVQLAIMGAGISLLLVGVGATIASGDLKVIAILIGVLAAPFLIALAATRPYLFPYGLYLVLVPFDNLLSLGSSGTATKLLGGLTIAAVLFAIVRQRRLVMPAVTVPLAVVYALWMLVTSLWAVDTGLAIEAVKSVFQLVLLYVVLSAAPIEERDLRAICLLVVIGGVAAALYGIWYLHQNPPSNESRLFVDVAGRKIDPNAFADSLLMPFALALVALTNARTVHVVLASLAAIALIGEGILITLSREGMLGCVLVGVVVLAMSRRRTLALALLLPALALMLAFAPSVVPRLADAISSGGAGRTSIWQVDLHAWLQHPIFGWGAGSAFQAYSANLLAVAPRDFAGWDRPPHNLVLNTLLDVGIIGFILLVAAFVMIFRQLSIVPRGDRLYDLRVGLTASLIGLAVVSLFIDNSTDKYVWVALCAVAQLRTVYLTRAAPAYQSGVP